MIEAEAKKSKPVAFADAEETAGASQNQMASNMLASKTNFTADGKQRQLVKTVDTSFEVKNVYKAAITIEDMVSDTGGFITHNSIGNSLERSRSYRSGKNNQTRIEAYRPNAYLTVRIPQDKVQLFMRELVDHVEFMHHRDFKAEDVVFDIVKKQQMAKVNAAARSIDAASKGDNELYDKVDAINSKADYEQAKVLAEIEKSELLDKTAFSTINIAIKQPFLLR